MRPVLKIRFELNNSNSALCRDKFNLVTYGVLSRMANYLRIDGMFFRGIHLSIERRFLVFRAVLTSANAVSQQQNYVAGCFSIFLFIPTYNFNFKFKLMMSRHVIF